MDAFEFLVGSLLRKEGYWVDTSYMVELTKDEKVAISRPSAPRWEIDLIAYKASENQILAVECKSFLDSMGVRYGGLSGRDLRDAKRYKLFNDSVLRKTVLGRLAKQLVAVGAVAKRPKITLCLAAGKIASATDRENIRELFKKNNWKLFDSRRTESELIVSGFPLLLRLLLRPKSPRLSANTKIAPRRLHYCKKIYLI